MKRQHNLINTKRQQAGSRRAAALSIVYRLRRRFLAVWFGVPLVQKRYHRKNVQIIRRYLRALAIPPSAHARLIRTMLTDDWLASHMRQKAELETFRPVCVTTGLATVKSFEGKRGVVLVGYHSPFSPFTGLALGSLGFPLLTTISGRAARRFAEEQAGGQDAGIVRPFLPHARATQLQAARSTLMRQGVVLIMGDGHGGQAEDILQPVADRLFAFKTGFAELALQNDAVVIPVRLTLDDSGRFHLEFHPPLDSGDEAMPRDVRVRLLVQQFATYFERSIRCAPQSLNLALARRLVKQAPIAGEE